MATTNHERVGKAMELLKEGLGPFVDREIKAVGPSALNPQVRQEFAGDPMLMNRPLPEWDVSALLKLMWVTWNDVFRNVLGFAERSMVSELRDSRNRWAHQHAFTSDDAYRVLDSAGRLLSAVSAPQAEEVERLKMELLRIRFDEQVRTEKRKSAGTAIESTGTLKPWREVVTPHPDVASGRYQQAEFAADLWQVHLGEGADEYRDPVEFFRRTYLTQSLKGLLVNGLNRISGNSGDPVVQLQTNFRGRQDPLDAGPVPHVLGRLRLGPGGSGDRDGRGRGQRAAAGPDGGPGGQQDFTWEPGHQARRHRGAHPLGRTGLATGGAGRL